MPSNKVRTRFAPSPTGYMHVGNLRTALYTYLMAKHEGGTFILRIEDTDQGRYVEGAVDVIYNTLRETGLLWDEGPDVGGPVGPYVQSERMGMFKQYAEQLVAEGKAYYCFCTEERLEALHAEQRAHGEGRHDLAAAQPKPEAHDGEQRFHGEGPSAGAAGERGGTLPCVMNAANEVAVAAFLAEEGSYLGIAACVEAVMDAHERQGVQRVESLDQLEELDAWARAEARRNVR